eukprot:maker-scaffold_49-snap-gene-0.0-mRNA-1 protein AED:0.07 eAED:0.07 QI:117/1/1/1/0.5/0.33/3/773/210
MRLTVGIIQSAIRQFNAIDALELDLRGLNITEVENLGATHDQNSCLDLSDNMIVSLDNFPLLRRLKILLLCNNKISTINPSTGLMLPNLTTLNLMNNKIAEFEELDKIFNLKKLEMLILIQNPVTVLDGYKKRVISNLQNLKVLDLEKISKATRDKFSLLSSATSKKEVAPKDKQPSLGKRKRIEAAIKNATTLEEVEQVKKLIDSGANF